MCPIRCDPTWGCPHCPSDGSALPRDRYVEVHALPEPLAAMARHFGHSAFHGSLIRQWVQVGGLSDRQLGALRQKRCTYCERRSQHLRSPPDPMYLGSGGARYQPDDMQGPANDAWFNEVLGGP